MKTTIKLLIFVLSFLSSVTVFGEEKNEEPKQDPTMPIIPIILTPKEAPMSYSLTGEMEGVIILDSEGLIFDFPCIDYPAIVKITGESGTSGYWFSIVGNNTDVMPFGGESGNYKLEISTAAGVYAGHFTL